MRFPNFTLALLVVTTSITASAAANEAAPLAVESALATSASNPRADAMSDHIPWRRTADGWENSAHWHRENGPPSTSELVASIHPGLSALFILLSSLGALLAFDCTSPKAGKTGHTSGPFFCKRPGMFS